MARVRVFIVAAAWVVIGGLGLTAASQGGFAQDAAEPYVIGESFSMHSNVLGEDRRILVYTPNGYEGSGATYPVMYLLDGDAHFHHTTGIIDFLSRNGQMPQLIVVAVPNTDRTRDLTPVTATDTANRFPTAGGADNFLSFLADELMPYVNANYRTAPYSILVGHSFGGLFAAYALLERPDAFDAYVSISPSLWWNDGAMIAEAEDFFANHDDADAFLYMTMGNEGGQMLAGAWEFAAVLEEMAPESFDWEFALMEEETHGSIPHRTTYRALERLYDGWQIPDFGRLADEGGLEAFDAHYASLSGKYGYEIVTPEGVVNQLGYWYLGQDRVPEAIATFKRNVEVYPGSANVYDSLGDGYDAAGDLVMAEQNYARAVELAEATDHPNLGVYRANLERIREAIGSR
ncbi:MAG: hypothetical protein JSU87_01180 [Gemmatimonadota bacterium]|nr:MAG: hypothetical protein JSU87_01180 [Gemmatimonadota bacterium]